VAACAAKNCSAAAACGALDAGCARFMPCGAPRARARRQDLVFSRLFCAVVEE
jgi:hypothetical protein